MPKVYNWQLGREMEYPYQESRPDKQVAWIFDTNKCIACQTCSVACKTTWTSGKGQEMMFWNNVETKPYGGYPLQWDIKILVKLKEERERTKLKDATIFEAKPDEERILNYQPESDDYIYPNIGEDECSGIIQKGAFFSGIHAVWMFYLAR